MFAKAKKSLNHNNWEDNKYSNSEQNSKGIISDFTIFQSILDQSLIASTIVGDILAVIFPPGIEIEWLIRRGDIATLGLAWILAQLYYTLEQVSNSWYLYFYYKALLVFWVI